MENLDPISTDAPGQTFGTSFARASLFSVLAGVGARAIIQVFAPSLGFPAYMAVFFAVFAYTFSLRNVGMTRVRRLLWVGAGSAIFAALMWASERWL